MKEEQLNMEKLSALRTSIKGHFTRAVKETEEWISKPHSEERTVKLTALKELLTQRYKTIDDFNQKFQQSCNEKQLDKFNEELDFAGSLNEKYLTTTRIDFELGRNPVKETTTEIDN